MQRRWEGAMLGLKRASRFALLHPVPVILLFTGCSSSHLFHILKGPRAAGKARGLRVSEWLCSPAAKRICRETGSRRQLGYAQQKNTPPKRCICHRRDSDVFHGE